MPKTSPTIRATAAIDVVEAAYSLDGPESEWLTTLLDRARADLDVGAGIYGFTGHTAGPDFAASPAFVERALSPAFQNKLLELNATAPTAIFDLLRKRAVTCGGLEQVLGATSPVVAQFRRVMASANVSDGFCLFAQDAQGGNITLSAPAAAPVDPSPRVRGIWQRVGLHVVAGLRLRRKLAARIAQREAILSPSGNVEDIAPSLASDGAARRALTDAVRAMDRARHASVRSSPERALELWRGLVAGQWSLVDHWESDGRRWVAAYANRPGVRDPRALTETEQSILRYVAVGATNKDAGYALGLSDKTVSSCVSQIMKKLRVRSRVDLAAVLDASRTSAFDLPLSDDHVRLLAIDVGGGALLERLTAAERAVAEGVARGLSNARIADARGVASSTIAKQLQAVYEKLGVDNRSQLARVASRHSR